MSKVDIMYVSSVGQNDYVVQLQVLPVTCVGQPDVGHGPGLQDSLYIQLDGLTLIPD